MNLRKDFTAEEILLIEEKLKSLNSELDKYRFSKIKDASIQIDYDTDFIIYQMLDARITITILLSHLDNTIPIFTVIGTFDYIPAYGHEIEEAYSYTLLENALIKAENIILRLTNEIYSKIDDAL